MARKKGRSRLSELTDSKEAELLVPMLESLDPSTAADAAGGRQCQEPTETPTEKQRPSTHIRAAVMVGVLLLTVMSAVVMAGLYFGS